MMKTRMTIEGPLQHRSLSNSKPPPNQLPSGPLQHFQSLAANSTSSKQLRSVQAAMLASPQSRQLNAAQAATQLKPVRASATGTSHIVKAVADSLYNGQEVPPPFGQIDRQEQLFIDDDVIIASRRGPNQERPENRDSDAQRQPDRYWFQVLKLKGQNVGGRNYYLREGTFVLADGPQVDESLTSVEDLVDLMDNALPAWASLHRAMAMEAEQFHELQKEQQSDDRPANRKTVHLYGNDRDSEGIADLSNIKTGGQSELSLHLGSAKMETYARQDYLRVYLSMVNPQTSRREQPDGPRYTTYKDTQQDETGEILIYGTQKSGSPDTRRIKGDSGHDTMFFNIGRPLRAYAWAKKYQAQHPEFAAPVVRSFLVPLLPVLEIMFGASTEHDKTAGNPKFSNVDMDRLGNQFAAGGPALSALEQLAVNGSMITYSDDVSSFDQSSGAIHSLSALAAEGGVPDLALNTALLTDGKSFRSTTIGDKITGLKQEKLANPGFARGKSDAEREQAAATIANKALLDARAKRPSSMIAEELQIVYAHWKDQASLLPGDGELLDDRTTVVKQFLEREGHSQALIDLFIQQKMR